MNKDLRKIIPYSTNGSNELKYGYKYYFETWLTDGYCLVQDINGQLVKAHYSEFRFETE